MIYKFFDDIVINRNDKYISFKKGCFNFQYSEILSNDPLWDQYNEFISFLLNNYDFNRDELKKYNSFILEFSSQKLIYCINQNKSFNLFISDTFQEIFKFVDLPLNNFKIIPIKDIYKTKINKEGINLIISIDISINELREINEYLYEKGINSYYFIAESDFVYIFHSSVLNGCFECFFQRMYVRLQKPNKEIFDKHINEINKVTNPYLLFGYLITFLEGNGELLNIINGNLLALYIRTFEVSINKFLRIPSCSVCGKYNNLSVLKNYNDLDKIIDIITEKVMVDEDD